MEKITSIEELKQLSHKDRFYFVSKDNHSMYMFCCINPAWDKSIIAIPSHNHVTAKVFSDAHFNDKNLFLKGKYNSAEIGAAMINFLKDDISCIEKVYLGDAQKAI